MPERITDKFVRDAEAPASGNRVTYDTEIKGFGLRVTKARAKAFILNYRIGGQERRYTIGSYPDWSVMAARKRAADLKREIDQGQDPLAERQEHRAAPTLADLYARYAKEHLPRKAERSAADDRSMWEKRILPFFGYRKVAEITHADCDRLHSEIAKTHPIRANRVIEVLRKAMNLAMRWGWRTDNPASGVHRNPEEGRERYLTVEETGRLMAALGAHPEKTSAAAIRLMVLTGCRRGEALSAEWTEFDLDQGVWTKPSAHTKQRRVHRVMLSDLAVELLRDQRRETGGGSFVFPGRNGKALTDIKRSWDSLRKAAGLPDVRLHDLRHTFASLLAADGHSLLTIGNVLGHTQAQTTKRYAHLTDDVQRGAVNGVWAKMKAEAPAG